MTRAGAQSAASTGFTFDAGFGIRESWTLSPDGTRFAFTQTTEDNRDIWVRNLDDGTSTRLLSPAERSESDPRWSSDGEALIYWARDSQVDRVFTIPANGTGAGPARCTAEAGSNRPLGALRKSGSFSLPG